MHEACCSHSILHLRLNLPLRCFRVTINVGVLPCMAPAGRGKCDLSCSCCNLVSPIVVVCSWRMRSRGQGWPTRSAHPTCAHISFGCSCADTTVFMMQNTAQKAGELKVRHQSALHARQPYYPSLALHASNNVGPCVPIASAVQSMYVTAHKLHATHMLLSCWWFLICRTRQRRRRERQRRRQRSADRNRISLLQITSQVWTLMSSVSTHNLRCVYLSPLLTTAQISSRWHHVIRVCLLVCRIRRARPRRPLSRRSSR